MTGYLIPVNKVVASIQLGFVSGFKAALACFGPLAPAS
jgi:hypothetical protein